MFGIWQGIRSLGWAGKYLVTQRTLWKYLLIPVFLNIALFALLIFGGSAAVGFVLAGQLPTAWWAAVLLGVLVAASMVGLVYVSAFLFVVIGSVISAPFYEVFAQKVAEDQNGSSSEPEGIVFSVKSQILTAWGNMKGFVLVQTILLILLALPGIGLGLYLVVGFLHTTFALAFQYLAFPLAWDGRGFADQRKWCMKNYGAVLGLGTGIFLFLGIPGINLLLPAIATIAGIRLVKQYSHYETSHR